MKEPSMHHLSRQSLPNGRTLVGQRVVQQRNLA